MSSPLNSLKKTKKSPINPPKNFGKRNIPIRNNDFNEERQMLESFEKSKDSVQPQGNSWPPTTRVSSKIKLDHGLAPNKISIDPSVTPILNSLGYTEKTFQGSKDFELLSTMMKRITQLEKQTAYFSKEVIEKDKKIKILEDKLAIMRKSQKKKWVGPMEDPEKSGELQSKCLHLQHQVYEMEKFLSDYGMVWVGDDAIEDPLRRSPTPTFTKPLQAAKSPNFHVDYDLIIRNARELSLIAGEGVSKIEKTKNGAGARLKSPDTIPLTLYANGITMYSGPFRSFNDATTRLCISDLMDGYFPSELQSRYPDGVPFKITDKRNTVFKDPRQAKEFPGVGRLLQSDEAGTSKLSYGSKYLSSLQSPDRQFDETSDLLSPRMTVDQFLQKLPSSVIQGGRVVAVKAPLKDHLTILDSSENAATTEIVQTKAFEENQERMNAPTTTKSASPYDVTTIRVKCEDGLRTFILKMKFLDTVAELRKYIDRQRPKFFAKYEIVSTFPKRVHTNGKRTLEESGLVPNATVHLRPAK